MTAVLGWARQNLAAYLDNGTARRDYRSQLRSSRSVVLWSVYLALLILVGVAYYGSQVEQGTVSVVRAQASLQEFYQTIMLLLAGMVVVVAPALAATAVVVERERRSLDLIFSAPVRPKNFLVGKMISAYRYIWMLLVLSLPVTSVCVVLGGATWGEVLAAYALLSLHALLLSALALLISTVSAKPVAAVVWSYIATFLMAFVLYGGVMPMALMPMGGPATGEAPFVVTLSPFLVVQAAGTHTMLFGHEVPNWALFTVFVAFFVRLLLLAAASALSPYGAPETKNFRISGLVAMGLLGAMVAWSVFGTIAPTVTTPHPGGVPGATTSVPSSDLFDRMAAGILAFLPLPLLFLMPHLCCFGVDGERKFAPDGVFSLRGMIRGTPSGALPYLLALLGITALAVGLAIRYLANEQFGVVFLSTLVWAVGFWTLVWAIGRYVSSANAELRAARVLHLTVMLVMLGIPVPLLTVMDPEQKTFLWNLYPLYPLWAEPERAADLRATAGAALLGIGLLIAAVAERNLRARIARSGVTA